MKRTFSAIPESRYRENDRDFSRNGTLSPELLTTFMMYMVADGNRRGIRHLLPDFWEEARDHGLPLPTEKSVSASAICQARARLNPEVFRQLLYALSASCEATDGSQFKRWRGRRVFAMDGAKVNLRRSPELTREFGIPNESHCPQILMSALVDVCSRAPVDVEVSGFCGSEREHLLLMLDSIEKGDLLILDRGYPSHEVLQACAKAGIEFLIRVPRSNTFKAVDRFRESGKSDAVVTINTPTGSDPEWKPLRVRLIRIEGPSEPSFYVSSLTRKSINSNDIKQLYHMRWEAEEYFKLFTSEFIGQKQFRSTSAHGVRQEVAALTLFIAISRILAHAANESLPENQGFVSQKGAVLTLAKYLTRIMLAPNPLYARRSIDRAMQRMLATRDKPRPDRSHPRRSFKPTSKWGPRGHRRD